MHEMVEPFMFYDNGSDKREVENFQNFLFKNVNLSNEEKPVSFFRSDFRSCKIIDSAFAGNNFDRADFIDAYIENTSFAKCYFGTDFINTFFKNVRFSNNELDICTFSDCYFEGCEFANEKITNCGYRNCQYLNCSFADCHYEMNTLDGLSFSDCFFDTITFSDSNSQNLDFESCILKKVILDPDYIGSYLFKKTPLDNITFKYRGKEFVLSDNISATLQGLKEFYLNQKRYPEFLNSAILYDSMANDDKNTGIVFETIMKKILEDEHIPRRKSNIRNIFRLLQFYSDSNMISSENYSQIIMALERIDKKNLNFADSLEFTNQVATTKSLFEESFFGENSGRTISAFGTTYMEICIEEDDLAEVKGQLDAIFTEIRKEYYKDSDVSDLFKIVSVRKGSLYLDIIGYTGAIVAFCAALKSVIKVTVFYLFSRKVIALLEKEHKTPGVKKVAEILPIVLRGTSEGIRQSSVRLSRKLKSVKICPNSDVNTW